MEHDARQRGVRAREGQRKQAAPFPRKREVNVAVAFNALLTSLDAKLPTSRFTADELRISNGRGRRSRSSSLHSLPRVVAASVVFSSEARVHSNFARTRERAQKTAEETEVGVNRDWRCNETFSCSVSHLLRRGLVPFPGWHDAFRTVLVVFYCETAA